MKSMRFFSLVLCLALLLSATACSNTDESWLDQMSSQLLSIGKRQANTGILTVHQLVQKIADAMRNEPDSSAAFDSIPERQRDGLTLDEFQQYIRLLRKGVAGTVTSFSAMSDSELEAIREEIGQPPPGQAESTADLCGFWIHYQETGRTEDRFGLYVREVEGQPADLYGDWVRQMLELQDLATLYFDALERYDRDALSFLLRSQDLPEDIIDIRAERLIRFYRDNITSRSAEFKVLQARIDKIVFEEFGIINPDRSQSVSRTIELVRRPDGSFWIGDILPEIIAEEDLQIFYQGLWLLQMGETDNGEPVQVRSGDLESIIGLPEKHDDSVCTTAANGVQRLVLTYDSLELKAEGTCFRHSRWNGLIKYLKLTSGDCSIGSGLSPGDSLTDLLRRYPFAAEAGFMLQGQSESGSVTLQFFMEDDTIQAIELTLD